MTIVGGTPAQGNPLPASATSLIVTLADSGQLRVTYVAQCGSLQSERSNELAVPIAEERELPARSSGGRAPRPPTL